MLVVRFFLSSLICSAAALLGKYFTEFSVDTWYQELRLSPYTPPSEVFSIVWPLLYFLMALSLCCVWQKKGQSRIVNVALTVFYLQLGLNVLWSFSFFVAKSPQWALVNILSLLFLTIITIFLFDRVSKVGAFLLLPYLFWLGFATYLNVEIVRLNYPLFLLP